jgi:hypothetical protein
MAAKKQNDPRWQRMAAAVESHRVEHLGCTVAEAAAQLGISRQAVHKAILKGQLGCITVNDFDGHPQLRFIPAEQVLAYKVKREQKRTG